MALQLNMPICQYANDVSSVVGGGCWADGGGGGNGGGIVSGGGGDVGSGCGISWDSWIFAFFEKALRTDGWTDSGRTNEWMDRPSYRDARTHLKIIMIFQKLCS